MSKALLLIGCLLSDTVEVIPEVSYVYFSSVEECNTAKSNPLIFDTYQEEFGNNVRIWCEEIKEKDKE